ncbi:nuclear transport factor 2 family protein [Kribbella sp. NPDC002412]
MSATQTVTETLLALEDELWRANRQGDSDFYAHYLRDDAIAVSKYGVMGKAEAVPVIRENQNPFIKTDRTDERVIVIDDHSAIVTYRVDVVALIDGNEVLLPSYASTIWTDASGEWRVAFHQQTAL